MSESDHNPFMIGALHAKQTAMEGRLDRLETALNQQLHDIWTEVKEISTQIHHNKGAADILHLAVVIIASLCSGAVVVAAERLVQR